MNLSTRSILCSRSSSRLLPAFSTQLRLFFSAAKRQEELKPNEETRTIILSPILDTPMPWSEYLPLRLEKRRYQRVSVFHLDQVLSKQDIILLLVILVPEFDHRRRGCLRAL
jgi:hypothetical protein